MLAAEKAGCWSDALALYEQALQNEAPARDANPNPNPAPAAAGPEAQALPGGGSDAGLSAAQRGHLHCLLQMGHLQGMLAQVDGWAARSTGAAHPAVAYSASQQQVSQRGHLHCLLQMGHLQGMLAQVDGWVARSTGAAHHAMACQPPNRAGGLAMHHGRLQGLLQVGHLQAC